MTNRNRTVACAAIVLFGCSAASGQSSSKVVQGPDGVTYRETRQVVERMIPVTEYQTRQEQVYQPRVTTSVQSYQQNYLTPVTEYRWVSRRRGALNPFVQPYWTHQLEPFTRWESRPATVQVPVPTTEWVAETRTVSSPVTTYKPVKEEHVSRVAISAPPATSTPTVVASRPELSPIGGTRMTQDPPKVGWQSSTASGNHYR